MKEPIKKALLAKHGDKCEKIVDALVKKKEGADETELDLAKLCTDEAYFREQVEKAAKL